MSKFFSLFLLFNQPTDPLSRSRAVAEGDEYEKLYWDDQTAHWIDCTLCTQNTDVSYYIPLTFPCMQLPHPIPIQEGNGRRLRAAYVLKSFFKGSDLAQLGIKTAFACAVQFTQMDLIKLTCKRAQNRPLLWTAVDLHPALFSQRSAKQAIGKQA